MGIAAYNRGSRGIARDADEAMPVAISRADRQAHKDHAERLQAQIARLERDLARARRCIAELRRSKEARTSEAREDLARANMTVSHLCRLAFPVGQCGCEKRGTRFACRKTTRDHVCVCVCHGSTQ